MGLSIDLADVVAVAVDDVVDVVLGLALPTTTGGAVMTLQQPALTRLITRDFDSDQALKGTRGPGTAQSDTQRRRIWTRFDGRRLGYTQQEETTCLWIEIFHND